MNHLGNPSGPFQDGSKWIAQKETLAQGRVVKMTIEESGRTIPYGHVLDLWKSDKDFRTFTIDLLAGVPFEAFRWETPSLTKDTITRSFECVVMDSPGLASHPNPDDFSEHFGNSEKEVVVFPNLGKDAILVVPCPKGPHESYGHFASFLRKAPISQKHQLWQTIGETMINRLSTKPVWLSTAGAGVPWLHVRLDNRPKYFGHGPYRIG